MKTGKRIVVKVGSALLVDAQTGQLRRSWLRALAADLAALRDGGADVVLVSSGSIALGRHALDLPNTTLQLDEAQAAAAVGQIRLAQGYQESLDPHGITAAQVLVTLEDSANRRRYLNSRATLAQLLSLGVLPIVNENDTVATDEIRYGDNDRLAAQIAVTVGADQLILLSDVDGFYSANPNGDPNAKRFDEIHDITPELEAMAGDAGTGLSKGGMKTKLLAARMAIGAGCAMAITQGKPDHALRDVFDGAPATWFVPSDDPKAARKKWISSMKAKGQLRIDAGAARALGSGKSLLPAGVTAVTGHFERGDAVEIADPDGHLIATGLSRYSSAEATLIQGRQTSDFETILGHPGRSVIVHRDDLAM